MKKNLLLFLMVFLMVFFVVNTFGQENPAAAYAEAMGYGYKTKTDSVGNQYGVTILPNGKEVNAWDFFRGKVEPKYSYCEKRGYLLKTKVQKHNSYKTECAVCYQNLKKRSATNLKSESVTGTEQDSIVEIPMRELMVKDGTPLNIESNIQPTDNNNQPEGIQEAVVSTKLMTATALPESFDWRNHNGHAYIGPIRNQGSGCGSCYAFAATAAAEGTYNVATGKYDSNCADFSESYLAFCIGKTQPFNLHFSGCGGANHHNYDLRAMVDIGTCDESYFPYSPAITGSNEPSCPSSTANAPKVKFASWHNIPCGDINAIKTAIMTYGVVKVDVVTTSAWIDYIDGIYSDNNTACFGYEGVGIHAVSLVGWGHDAAQGDYWILRNSWGSSFGQGGYMKISVASAYVACGAGYLTYDNITKPVTGISLTAPSLSLDVSKTTTLAAIVSPSNATNNTITWSTNKPAVATVSSTGFLIGTITGVSIGNAVITATTKDGGLIATCDVTVTKTSVPVTSVSLNGFMRWTETVNAGATKQYKVSVSPSNATNQKVFWTSSNPEIATVSSTGFVTGIVPGATTITVTTQDGGYYATSYTAVIVPVTGVTVTPATVTIDPGVTPFQLSTTVSPSNATNKSVTWSTSDPNIATVSPIGLLSGINPGNAIITATTKDGGKTATCDVTVTNAPVPVTGVALNVATTMLKIGSTTQLTAVVSPLNAANKALNWSTSNAAVATVNQTGLVKGVAKGNATIKVTTKDGGKTATCDVIVAETIIPVTGVTIIPTSVAVNIGSTKQLTAVISPSNATNQNVTWSTSNPAIATVSSTGLVMGVAVGSTYIGVTTQDGNKVAVRNVTVTNTTVPVTGVTLNTSATSVNVGATTQLTATVLPSNATNKTVTWSTSDPAYATVNSTGLVTGVKAGSATITVTSQADATKKATCAVTVTITTVPVTGVTLNTSTATVNVGATTQLTATVAPSNATNKTVTWNTSDAAYVTVSSTGLVKGVKAGSATITVTTQDGGKTAACAVTVTNTTIPVTGVSISPASLTVGVGSTLQLTAVISPSNATNQNVTWSLMFSGRATISSSGLLMGVSSGSDIVTVTTQDGKKTASKLVTVTALKTNSFQIATDIEPINSETVKPSFDVYPNPAGDKLFISPAKNSSIVSVKVLDMRGAEVQAWERPQDLNFDISNLPSAPYILVITTDKGKTLRKFIKQ